jgi:hypothetical protein
MSRYVFDGEMYAGWSTGRWFGLAGVVALGFAWMGREMTHGWLASSLSASDHMFAFFLEWVGAGLFFMMAVAVSGSLMVSWQERGDVEVTEAGVRRIFTPGREKFVPREKIAGLAARMGGGVTLVDENNAQLMVVPRSILGYRDCIAELKGMGIKSLPPQRAVKASVWKVWKQMTWVEWIQTIGAYSAGTICLSRGSMLQHLVSGAICVGFFVWMGFDYRRNPKPQPVWVLPAAMVAGLAILMAAVHHW